MSIVGKVECNGPAQVLGRIEGELRASDLLVGDGAAIDGSVIAQNITICGHVKGTIRACVSNWRTVLRSRETFFIGRYRSMRTLSLRDHRGGSKIQSTRRLVLTEQARRKKKSRARPPRPDIDGDLQRVESALTDWSESTVEPKH
jgi:hypothetical protein